MPRKLPEGFKKAFRGLIAQGYKPKDAMREAWRVYKGEAPGMTRRKLNPIAVYNPRRRRKIYGYQRTPQGKRPIYRKEWLERESRRKLNPEMRPRIQVSKKSHRGKLRPSSPLKGYRINSRSIVTGAKVLPMHNVEIRYQRSNGEYQSEWFKHPFKSTVEILGLTDGSILIRSKSGKTLWGTV